MTTIDETYFGIRLGDPRRHKCYLMLSLDDVTPALFPTREEAELHKPKQANVRVVRVKISSK